MQFDYMFWIRILHLCIAVLLAWGSISYLLDKDVPLIWYWLILAFAVAAGGYHGHRLIERMYL